MGKLISFPGKKKTQPRRKVEDLLLERLPDHEQHCQPADLRFTCASCGTTARFNFSGIVFRECSFYCGHCGVGYKLDNPLFGRKKDKKSQ